LPNVGDWAPMQPVFGCTGASSHFLHRAVI
jgi:hypothetical protein